MKIVAYIAIFLCLSSFSHRDEYTDPVMDFVYSSYGERVGDGVCITFVEQAMNQKYNDWFNDYYSINDSMEAKNVTSPSIGDVALFVYDEKKMAHIGIVVDLRGDTMTVASQNNGDENEQFSKVFSHGDTAAVYKNSKVECYDVLISEWQTGLYCFRF